MATITTIIGAALLFVLSMLGVHKMGKDKGREQQKNEDDKKAAEEETVILKSEAEGKKQSEQITQKIDNDVSAYHSGDAFEWLQQNADRNKNNK